MSSMPQHQENMEALERLGIDVSAHKDEEGSFYDSWDYDSLVEIVSDLIPVIANLKKEDELKEAKKKRKMLNRLNKKRG